MSIATSFDYETPQVTKVIVISVASVLTLVLGTYFYVSFRRNQRGGGGMGELTPTEARVNRSHGVAIMAVLVLSMGLAIGAVLSATVRDSLSEVGDHSPRIPLLFIPAVLLYLRWLGRRMRAINVERAAIERDRPNDPSS